MISATFKINFATQETMCLPTKCASQPQKEVHSFKGRKKVVSPSLEYREEW